MGSGRSTTDPLDRDLVLPTLIERRAEAVPDRVFLIDVDRRTATFGQFQQRVDGWVEFLADLGVTPGDRVATMLAPSVDAQAVWLACGWLGALEVPINVAYQGRMLSHVLTDSEPTLIVAEARFTDRFDKARRLVVVEDLPEDLFSALAGRAARRRPMPWDTAAVMYTSGTTGPSKGVLVPWGQLATSIDVFDDCDEGDVLFAPFATSHVAGKVPLQLMAYWNGTHVFREAFKTQAFWSDVKRHRCNRVWLFHAMANFVWRQPPRDDDADNPIETMTGGPMLHEYREFEARFGVRMRTNFGMTEAGWPIATGDEVPNHLTCGRARPGYDLRIVDEHDVEVPDGEMGELIVRADLPWVMNVGYFGLPDKTAEAWTNGWFHTGDAFRRDADGNWYFVDRIKDAIRRRSENVSSFEVESFVGEHERVLECAAIGVPSADGEEEIKVCVVAKPGQSVAPAELASFLASRMPAFMVPRFIEIVDELPKTPTGKVRKVELKASPFTATTWDRMEATVRP